MCDFQPLLRTAARPFYRVRIQCTSHCQRSLRQTKRSLATYIAPSAKTKRPLTFRTSKLLGRNELSRFVQLFSLPFGFRNLPRAWPENANLALSWWIAVGQTALRSMVSTAAKALVGSFWRQLKILATETRQRQRFSKHNCYVLLNVWKEDEGDWALSVLACF